MPTACCITRIRIPTPGALAGEADGATAYRGGAVDDGAPFCHGQDAQPADGPTDVQPTSSGPEPKARVRLVYIAGSGHVGSTLLELMLNAHPLVVSGGELKVVHRASQVGGTLKCTCGGTAATCTFWALVSNTLERNGGPSLSSIKTDGTLTPDDVAANVRLLQTMAELTGTQVIVDSSKSTSRLRKLMESPDLEVLPVVLYRDPRGQVFSEVRKRRSLLIAILRFDQFYRSILRALGGRPHAFLCYEDLVAAPEATLRALMPALGLHFDPLQFDWGSAEHHGLGGNRMRRKRNANTAITADESWRAGLSPFRQWLVKWGTRRVRSQIAKSEVAHEVVEGSAARVTPL